MFIAYASEINIDDDTFTICLETGKYIEEVMADYADGVSYGITGTPAFFLGNEQLGYVTISGARSYQEFQFAIEQLLSIINQQ